MDSSLFQRVVRELEHHPECDRIKKLMHWVCTQTWCQEPQTLAIAPLLMGLTSKANTLHALHTLLLEGAQTLNKQRKYTQVGELIVEILTPIYPNSSAPDRQLSPPPISNPTVTTQPSCQAKADYDVFEIRLAVIKYTTPLKAKILIKAVLEQQILLQPKHWFLLRQSSLDELLYRLYQTHPDWTHLEQCLMQVTVQLASVDQIEQTLHAVCQALRPLYPTSATASPVSVINVTEAKVADFPSEDLDEMTSVILPPATAAISTQVWNLPKS